MDIVLATVAAALLGALGPWVIAKLPEPDPDPHDDEPKLTYAHIAGAPRLAGWLALGAGVLGAAVAWGIEREAVLAAWVVFCGVGMWLAYVDVRTRYLPFRLTAPLHAATLVLVLGAAVVTRQWSIAIQGLAAMVVVFALFWLMWAVGRLFGAGAFGYGDVRLGAIVGLALGPLGLVATEAGVLMGLTLGAVAAIVTAVRSASLRHSLAYGPNLVLGAVLGAVWPRIVG